MAFNMPLGHQVNPSGFTIALAVFQVFVNDVLDMLNTLSNLDKWYGSPPMTSPNKLSPLSWHHNS